MQWYTLLKICLNNNLIIILSIYIFLISLFILRLNDKHQNRHSYGQPCVLFRFLTSRELRQRVQVEVTSWRGGPFIRSAGEAAVWSDKTRCTRDGLYSPIQIGVKHFSLWLLPVGLIALREYSPVSWQSATSFTALSSWLTLACGRLSELKEERKYV